MTMRFIITLFLGLSSLTTFSQTVRNVEIISEMNEMIGSVVFRLDGDSLSFNRKILIKGEWVVNSGKLRIQDVSSIWIKPNDGGYLLGIVSNEGSNCIHNLGSFSKDKLIDHIWILLDEDRGTSIKIFQLFQQLE